MYYLLKDGTSLRRSVVAQIDPSIRDEVDSFISDACRILRSYGRGRTVMSAIVAVVVGLAALLLGLPLVFTIVVANFIGGYIPYIGAFLGGGLAVIVAWGDGGLGVAAVMLVVVLASNLLLENFVEPKVMGRTLDIHPLLVLVVTALGGFLFGIVGLILAVPFTVIARQRRRPPPGERLLHAGGRPSPAGREEDARVTPSRSEPTTAERRGSDRRRRARQARAAASERARGARGPAPGSGAKPARCGERSRRGLRLSDLPVAAALRPGRRRRARTRQCRRAPRKRSRAAVSRRRSPTRSATPRVPRTPTRGGSSRWACRSSSGRDSRARRRSMLIHSLVWDEPPPKPKPLQASLAFTGMACAFLAAIALTWWVRDDWPGLFAPVLTFAPLAAMWLWVSLHLPHRDAPWKALLPGALLVAIGFQVLHEADRPPPRAEAREVDLALRRSRRHDDVPLLHVHALDPRRHRARSQQLALRRAPQQRDAAQVDEHDGARRRRSPG